MKNKFLIIFILVLIIISGVIYFVINNREQTYEVEQEIYSEIAVIRIKDETLTNKNVTILIENKSEGPIGYDEWYRIDKEIDGEWVGITPKNEDYIFDGVAYLIDSGKEIEEKIDWTDSVSYTHLTLPTT